MQKCHNQGNISPNLVTDVLGSLPPLSYTEVSSEKLYRIIMPSYHLGDTGFDLSEKK